MSVKGNVTGIDKLISKAQTNVTTILKNIQKGLVNVGGTLKVFYEAILNIYKDGVEYISMVQGYVTGTNQYQENADHIRIQSTGSTDSTAENSTVTDIVVDLTNFKKLYVEWEGLYSQGTSYLFITTTKSTYASNTTGRLAMLQKTGAFAKITESIDVSALTGSAYIRVHVVANKSSAKAILTYKLWLE